MCPQMSGCPTLNGRFAQYLVMWHPNLYLYDLVQIEYPEIEDNTKPRHRFMSSFEQVYWLLKSSIYFGFFS